MAIGFVLLPLWIRNRAESFVEDASRKNENVALFQERSDELENELSSGNLSQAEFDVLIQEMQQSLLLDVSDEEITSKTKREKRPAAKCPA